MLSDEDHQSLPPLSPEAEQKKNAARLAIIRWISEMLVEQLCAEATAQNQEPASDATCDIRQV